MRIVICGLCDGQVMGEQTILQEMCRRGLSHSSNSTFIVHSNPATILRRLDKGDPFISSQLSYSQHLKSYTILSCLCTENFRLLGHLFSLYYPWQGGPFPSPSFFSSSLPPPTLLLTNFALCPSVKSISFSVYSLGPHIFSSARLFIKIYYNLYASCNYKGQK